MNGDEPVDLMAALREYLRPADLAHPQELDAALRAHVEAEHAPCCSAHGITMTCTRYRRTHFVEVRPCCAADAAVLAEATRALEDRELIPRPHRWASDEGVDVLSIGGTDRCLDCGHRRGTAAPASCTGTITPHRNDPVRSRDVDARGPHLGRHDSRWTDWGWPPRTPLADRTGPPAFDPPCTTCGHTGHDDLCPVLVPHPGRPTASLCPCGET